MKTGQVNDSWWNNLLWWVHDRLDGAFHLICAPGTWLHQKIRAIYVKIAGGED